MGSLLNFHLAKCFNSGGCASVGCTSTCSMLLGSIHLNNRTSVLFGPFTLRNNCRASHFDTGLLTNVRTK